MSAKRAPSPGDRVGVLVNRHLSESKLVVQRNMAFGTAGVCLLILLSVYEQSPASPSLTVTAFAAGLGMPFWILAGSILEIYIHLGKRGYVHYRRQSTQHALGLVFLAGVASMLTAIASLLLHVSTGLAITFGASTLLSLVFYAVFIERLGIWWFSDASGIAEQSDCG